MRRNAGQSWLVVLSVLLALVVGGGGGLRLAAAQAAEFKLTLTADEEAAAKALLLGAMADYFGVDTKVVIDLAEEEAKPLALLTAFYLAGDEKVAVKKVLKVQKQHGWGYFKKQHRYRPKWKRGEEPRQEQDWERFAFARFIHEYYNVPSYKVLAWLKQGLTPQDIILAVNIAQKARVDVNGVIAKRLRGLSWRAITAFYRLRWDWDRDHRPRRQEGPHFQGKIIINF